MAQQIINTILPDALLAQTQQLKNDGYRLAAISCTSKDDLELTYSFDKDYDLMSLRLHVTPDDAVESISGIYAFAFLYENEIRELFGAKIINISLDFNDNLYKTTVKTPFGVKKKEANDGE